MRRHRLDEIVERTERDAQLWIVDHADDHDRNIAGGCFSLESREHLPAVEVGKKYVEGDRGRFSRGRFGQGLAAGAGNIGAEAGPFELPRQQLGGCGIVLDNKDEGTRGIRRAAVKVRGVDRLCLVARHQRQADGEDAALSWLAQHANVATVEAGETAREREPKPSALLRAGHSRVDLLKLVEDPILVLFGDADASVRNRKLHRVIEAARGDGHRSAFGSELHRVGHQVEQHLLDLAAIGVDVARRALADHQLDSLLGRQRLHGADDLAHDVGHHHRLQSKLHLAGLDLRQVEDVVDQTEQMLAARVDLLQEPLACRRRKLPVVRIDQQLGETQDRVERCAQLVTHAGKEDALVAIGFTKLDVRLPDSLQQPGSIERGNHRGHELLNASQLVRPEAGRERPRHHHQAAGLTEARQRQGQDRAVDTRDRGAADSFRQVRQAVLDLSERHRIDAPRRDRHALCVECRGGSTADQSHRPLERAPGQGDLVLLEEQEVFHERAQTILFRGPPFASQPCRWREADVEQRHDRENEKLDDELHRLIGRGGARADSK